MTSEELIEALQRECRTDRLKVEDFLGAFVDLMIEALKKGETFNFGCVGFFAASPPLPILPGNARGTIIFQSSTMLRKRLGLIGEAAPLRGSHVCKTCGLAPCAVRVYDECDACATGAKNDRDKD